MARLRMISSSANAELNPSGVTPSFFALPAGFVLHAKS
jgi:hypothetical protein